MQGILTGIVAWQKAGQRGLFVPVPVDSTIGIISGKMEELAASGGRRRADESGELCQPRIQR